MYKIIRQHPSTLELYSKKLVADGHGERGRHRRMRARSGRSSTASSTAPELQAQQGRLARRPLGRPQGRARGRGRSAPRRHGVDAAWLREIGDALTRVPEVSASTARSSASSTTASA
jgi:2-oxoglutarate dehydrogenase E1 component